MRKLLTGITISIFLLSFSTVLFYSYNAKAADISSQISFEKYDANDDWKIDLVDLAFMAKLYNTTNKNGGWNSLYDFNKDNIIDVLDLTLLSKNIGNEQGNTFGNVNNMGLIAKKGEYRYYSNQYDHGYLYSMNSNCTSITRLSTDEVRYINAIGDWVYYTNVSDNGYLYKITNYGGIRTRLNTDITLSTIYSNGFLYYINASDNYSIYKISTDGSQKAKLTATSANYINVINNYIYYTDDNAALYKIKIDGKENTKIADNVEEFLLYNDWIYYTNYNDNSFIYKMKLDGTSNTRIINKSAAFINVAKGIIYFAEALDSNTIAVSQINLDGSGYSVCTNDGGFLINTVSNNIYFIGLESPNLMYTITPDLAKEPFGNFTIYNIADISVSITVGTPYSLPKTLPATKYDGSKVNVEVEWDKTTIDTNIPGTYTFYGTVAGCPGTPKVTVKVFSIKSIEDLHVTVKKGQAYTLPDTVKVVLSDNTSEFHAVSWLSSPTTDTVGDYIVEGTVYGYDKKVKFYLSVVEPSSIPNGIVIAQVGEWSYYFNQSDSGKLYRMKADGSVNSFINNATSTSQVKITNDCIYYSTFYETGIYKMNLDGSNIVKLSDGSSYRLQLDGNYLYYSDTSDERLYKVNILTNERSKVMDQPIIQYVVSNGWVYFHNDYFTYGLYKVKADGTQLQSLIKDYLNVNHPLYVVGNFVVYQSNSGVYRINIDGTQNTHMSTTEYTSGLMVDSGYVYFNDNGIITKMSLDGTSVSTFPSVRGELKSVVNGWIYFINYPDGLIYRMRTDGTDVQIVA